MALWRPRSTLHIEEESDGSPRGPAFADVRIEPRIEEEKESDGESLVSHDHCDKSDCDEVLPKVHANGFGDQAVKSPRSGIENVNSNEDSFDSGGVKNLRSDSHSGHVHNSGKKIIRIFAAGSAKAFVTSAYDSETSVLDMIQLACKKFGWVEADTCLHEIRPSRGLESMKILQREDRIKHVVDSWEGEEEGVHGAHFAVRTISDEPTGKGAFFTATEDNILLRRPEDWVVVKDWLINGMGNMRNVHPDDGMTLAMRACQRGALNILFWLNARDPIRFRDVDAYGRTMLHVAVEGGHINILNFISTLYDFNIEVRDNLGRTAAHMAVFHGRTETLGWLADHGLHDSALRDFDGVTLGHMAALQGYTEVLEWLGDIDFLSVENDGDTMAHFAAKNGHLCVLKWLHERNGVRPNLYNNDGDGLEHYATAGGHLHVLRWLQKTFRLDLRHADLAGDSVVHYAAKYGQLQVLMWLYRRRIFQPEEFKLLRNGDGNTVAHFAAINGHVDVLEWAYSKNIIFDSANSAGDTLGHLAAGNNHTTVLAWLYDHHMCSLSARNKREETLVHCAASGLHIDTLKWLSGCRATLTAKDGNERSPAHIAAINGSVLLLKWLDTNGAVATSALDKEGNSLVNLAAVSGSVDVMKWLATHRISKTAPNHRGQTNAVLAVMHGRIEMLEFLFHNWGSVDINEPVDSGMNTLVHVAANHSQLEVLSWLNAHGANLNALNGDEENAAHTAAAAGHMRVLEFLHVSAVRMHALNYDQNSPAMLAAAHGQAAPLEWFDRILRIDWSKKNRAGDTAAHLATAVGSLECLELLCTFDDGFSMEYKNVRFEVPAHTAAANGHAHVLEWMMERPDWTPFVTNALQETLGHVAAGGGRLHVLELLKTAQILDLTAKDAFGRTVADIAMEERHTRILQWLARIEDYAQPACLTTEAHDHDEDAEEEEHAEVEDADLDSLEEEIESDEDEGMKQRLEQSRAELRLLMENRK